MTAATIENPIIHLKVRNAIRPIPEPLIEPVATMTDVITSGTIDIWISRMNRSPTNLTLLAHSPTIRPNTMPATAARPIWAAGCLRIFIAASGAGG